MEALTTEQITKLNQLNERYQSAQNILTQLIQAKNLAEQKLKDTQALEGSIPFQIYASAVNDANIKYQNAVKSVNNQLLIVDAAKKEYETYKQTLADISNIALQNAMSNPSFVSEVQKTESALELAKELELQKAKTKRYLIIGGVIVGVTIITISIIYFIRKSKK